MNFYHFSGVIHLHTIYSKDSELTPLELIKYAKKFNIDFLIITDHNTIEGKKFEGYYNNKLLIVGEEITPYHGDHILAIGIENLIEPSNDSQNNINRIDKEGGLSFIEHPFFNGNRFIKKEANMAWKNWDIKNFTGLSIFNYTCDGGERLNLFTYILFYFFPGLDRDIPNYKTLNKWDELNQTRKVIGIGTLDAHFLYFKIFKKLKIQTFPFNYYFNSIRTNIITEESNLNKNLVFNSLKNGNIYIIHQYLGDGKGFIFGLEKGGDFYLIGRKVLFQGKENLIIKTPKKCLIRIIKDGKKYFEKYDKEIYLKNVPFGIYRIETEVFHRFNYKPWIYSNPIYLLDETKYEKFL
ncbi:MAG: PHP domain-containing protein [Caldisericia bacterium]|nr:PHP domain-containing protein [Caldisericia bacterium]